jgi:hypothetical protein
VIVCSSFPSTQNPNPIFLVFLVQIFVRGSLAERRPIIEFFGSNRNENDADAFPKFKSLAAL